MGDGKGATGIAKGIASAAVALWMCLILAYGAGYLGARDLDGFGLILTVLTLAFVALLPVALLYAVLRLQKVLEARPDPAPAPFPDMTALTRPLEDRIAVLEARLAALEAAPPVAAQPAEVSPPAAPAFADIATAAEGAAPENPGPEARPADGAPGPTPPAAPSDIPAEPATDGQPMLPFGDPVGPELTLEDTIRALNFPQNAQDRAGFAVLAKALQSHQMARLLQASEDCLNFLAHQGLYMDDLLLAPAAAEDWRTFAKGGAARAALLPLTGITDRKALEAVQTQMRADPIFRDAALHFQRRFDRMLHEVAPHADDAALLHLMDTRTGRAFILFAQASGSLDRGA